MRVALTGTPGTGKTTVAERVETDLETVHLNDLIRDAGLHDGTDERGSLVADLDAVRDRLADRRGLLVESHLAHLLDDLDRVVVVRCHPETVAARLRERGESAATAAENAESEALDVILAEAVDRHGREAVSEVETTDRGPDAVARAVEAVLAGEREPGVGGVDYSDYLQP